LAEVIEKQDEELNNYASQEVLLSEEAFNQLKQDQ
jgi:hypothetical protein